MRIFITIYLSLVSTLLFCQTKSDVIKDIKKKYSQIENNQTNYRVIQLNDTISYLSKDQRPVKVTIKSQNITEYYYYDSLNSSPYFIYSKSSTTDDKYYFHLSSSGPILYEWTSRSGKVEDDNSQVFQNKNNYYFQQGKNIFTLIHNSQVDITYINNTLQLKKSLSPYIIEDNLSPNLDKHVTEEETFEDDEDFFEDHEEEPSLGESKDSTYFIHNKKVEVTEGYSWYDRTGGGTHESISFRILKTKELISIEKNCVGILDQRNGYYIMSCSKSIYHNNSQGKCVSIITETIGDIQFNTQLSVSNCPN